MRVRLDFILKMALRAVIVGMAAVAVDLAFTEGRAMFDIPVIPQLLRQFIVAQLVAGGVAEKAVPFGDDGRPMLDAMTVMAGLFADPVHSSVDVRILLVARLAAYPFIEVSLMVIDQARHLGALHRFGAMAWEAERCPDRFILLEAFKDPRGQGIRLHLP